MDAIACCRDCGHSNPSDNAFCGRCGSKLATKQIADYRDVSELLFCDENTIVTSKRIASSGKIFFVATITALDIEKHGGRLGLAVLLLVAGVLLLFAESLFDMRGVVVGLGLVAYSLVLWYDVIVPNYSLAVKTNGDRLVLVRSRDAGYLEMVAHTIRQAMAK